MRVFNHRYPYRYPYSIEYNPTERTAPRETESVSETRIVHSHYTHPAGLRLCSSFAPARNETHLYSTNEPHLTPHNRQSAMPLSVGTTHVPLRSTRGRPRRALLILGDDVSPEDLLAGLPEGPRRLEDGEGDVVGSVAVEGVLQRVLDVDEHAVRDREEDAQPVCREIGTRSRLGGDDGGCKGGPSGTRPCGAWAEQPSPRPGGIASSEPTRRPGPPASALGAARRAAAGAAASGHSACPLARV